MNINYDFGDLEAFLALFETASFARAAERLNISQSALSRRLQKLEAALGARLFDRTTRSVAPTLQGRAFVDYATALLQKAEAAASALGGDMSARRRTAVVTVAAVPTATQTLLPEALQRYRAAGRDARVRISDVTAAGVVDAIATGAADFGVGFLSAREADLDFRPISDDPFVLVLPSDDPLARQDTLRWREIDPDRFIAIWRGSGNRLLIESALARERIALDWSFEVQHLATALGLVEAGLGMTALPRSAIPPGRSAAIVARRLIEPEVTRVIGLARRRRARLSDAAEALYQTLLAGASTAASDATDFVR